MNKVYKKLTQEQKSKGIIFTSTLSKSRTELESDLTHTVYNTTDNKTRKIALLKDDSFFNSSPWEYNIIRK